ncbi:MAG: hypothetical protein EOO03_17400, partial [Chitinophagaceae bacterium]
MQHFTLKAGITIAFFFFSLRIFAQVPAWDWAQKTGNNSNNESTAAIAFDASGNSFVAGNFEGTITLGATTLSSNGGRDVYIAKYNPAGLLLWAQKAGGAGFDQVSGLTFDAAGNFLITGQFQSAATFQSNPASGNITLTATGTTDMFVA